MRRNLIFLCPDMVKTLPFVCPSPKVRILILQYLENRVLMQTGPLSFRFAEQHLQAGELGDASLTSH